MEASSRVADARWRSPLAEFQREFVSGGGLTDEQAVQRLKRYGRNTLRKDRPRPLVREFLSRLRNALVLILLVAASLAVMAAAALVPWTPLAAYFGFVPPPLSLYGVVAAMVAIYLVLVQWVKRRFYQLHPAA